MEVTLGTRGFREQFDWTGPIRAVTVAAQRLKHTEMRRGRLLDIISPPDIIHQGF